MPEDRPRPGAIAPTRASILLVASSSALLVAVLGGFVEQFVIAFLQPSQGELGWVSDFTLASALGVVLYLWLHLKATRAALVEAERSAIVLHTQLGVAARIQRDLLPPLPASRGGMSWAVAFLAAGRIGGDYYDFVDVDGHARVCIVADISGKGIPAAMLLAFVRAVFREAVRDTRDPGEIAERLSRAVHANTGGVPYVTCIVACVDERSRRLTMTNAGHPRAVLLSSRAQALAAGGPPAGLLPDATYAVDAVDLRSGDRVVFVTDGISERLSDPFPEVAASLDRSQSAEALCTRVFQLTEGDSAHPPAEDWDDDRTVVVLAVD